MICKTCNVNIVPDGAEAFGICPLCAYAGGANWIEYQDARTLALREMEVRYLRERVYQGGPRINL